MSSNLGVTTWPLCSFDAPCELARSGGCNLQYNLPNSRAQVNEGVTLCETDMVNHLTDQVV